MAAPCEQTLAAAHKNVLHKPTESSQPVHFIPFALYRLLIENFQGFSLHRKSKPGATFRVQVCCQLFRFLRSNQLYL